MTTAQPSPPPATREGFQIAIICALPEERDAVEAAMTRDYKGDDKRTYGKAKHDDNQYTLGELGDKPVVVVTPRNMGTINTSHLAKDMRHSFPNIAYALVVGIAGGAPFKFHEEVREYSDIQLGDVVISTQVVGYDFGAEYDNDFKKKTAVEDILPRAPTNIANFMNTLRTRASRAYKRVLETTNEDLTAWGPDYARPDQGSDCVYHSQDRHKHQDPQKCQTCAECTDWHHAVCETALTATCDQLGCTPERINALRETRIHFGRIASGNAVMKSARRRDKLIQEDRCIGFEMEGAGTWEVFGTIVIKGVVDYADSHKNKKWRLYPAARAALCAKALINEIELPDAPTEPSTVVAETSPSLTITVPFRRDPEFIDRPELDQLQKRLSCPSARLALFGIGGVGKSQIVIEYCYRLRERSPDTWVLWIHASSTARFEEGIRDIADQVGIPGRHDAKADMLQLFQGWLRDARKGRWLLVLDNADEATYLFQSPGEGKSTKRHVDYLPICEHGSIIMTTRNRDMASQFVADDDVITVSPMGTELALALLEHKSGRQNDTASARQLVDALEGMPLAIAQAAAYIKQRMPRFSLEQYLEKFKQSEESGTSLLQFHSNELRRDREAKNSILLTWQISFEHIRQSRRSAADLLSVMSFFDHQAIPESLLRVRDIRGPGSEHETGRSRSGDDNDNIDDSDDSDESRSGASADDEFEADVNTLRNYLFISGTPTETTFQMHRLVQIATRNWLKLHKHHMHWLEQSLWHLNAVLPDGNYEDWAECRALYPHAKLAFDLRPKRREASLQWASISEKVGLFMLDQGLAADAERFAKGSADLRKELLSKEHPDTLISMSNLALTYWNQGRWEEAEELEVSVVEIRKRVLGEEHPSTLTSISNLALTYWKQGRWKEAEELDMSVVEIRKRVLGEEHPDTLTSMSNLASTYLSQGRWEEAEELQVSVVEIRKRVLGEEHPDTLTSMSNLASTYLNQGRWEEAEELEVSVVETSKRVLGEEHPDTLINMANLASTYWKQGRWKEAEELEVSVVEIRKRVLGEEHPDTLINMANLASTYWKQGRWKEAEELNVSVLETRKRVLSEDHPSTLASIANLASTYQSQGRWKEAEELEVSVVEIRKRVLSEEHPDTLTSMANLASTYWNQGRLVTATLLRKTIDLASSAHGPDYHDIPDWKYSLNKLEHCILKSQDC